MSDAVGLGIKTVNPDDMPSSGMPQASLDNIFKERESSEGSPQTKAEEDKSEKQTLSKDKKEKDLEPKKEIIHLKKTQKKEVKEVNEEEDDEEPLDTKEQIEIKRLKKALSDSQSWGHKNAQKGKIIMREMGEMLKNQAITEEEFKRFDDIWGSDSVQEEEQIPHDESLVNRLIRVSNKELERLEDIYGDDPHLKLKIEMFGHVLDEMPNHEGADLLEELDKISDRPLKLATKMYRIGEEYYDKYYKNVREMGGLGKYIEARDAREEKLQKQVDKLKNKLTQYETNDRSPFRLEELNEGKSDGAAQAPQNVLEAIYAERDRSVKGQRN